MHADREKNNEQISTSKDNNFSRWTKENASSSTISNNSLKHPGSKPETEETSNTINVIPAPDENNKNMKDSTCKIMSEKTRTISVMRAAGNILKVPLDKMKAENFRSC